MIRLTVIIVALLLVGCASTTQIGSVNMISNRNIDSSEDYVLIKTYMGASKHEIKKSRSESIEEAIDEVVRATPGGEFLKNTKIYLVNGKYIAVEGDVWGTNENINFRGFHVGDKVQWTKMFKDYTGTIVDLKNDVVCIIKRDSDEVIVEVEYKELVRLGKK